MRNPLRQHPAIIIATALIIIVLTWGFWPQPVAVETVAVKRAAMSVSIEEEGRTRVIDRYVIAAPVDGVTCNIHLNVGDSIKKDQELLFITPLESQVLDPRSRAEAKAHEAMARSALQAAEEKARAASASANFAVIELKRLRPLVDKGLVSREIYDKAKMEVQTSGADKRSADFNVEVAQYELEAARSVLKYSAATDDETPAERVAIRSPINGKILKLTHECEGPVRTGEPLLEVGDTSILEVEVDVLSADAVKIKQGMKVLFDRWGGDIPLHGTVRTVEPVGFTKVSALGVEEQRVLVIIDFTSATELWQRLGDGYRVEARFVLWQNEDVLQVPASSLFRDQDDWAVFVLEGNYARQRVVKIGQQNGVRAQILAGLKEGEIVINHPSDEVEDGRRIRLR